MRFDLAVTSTLRYLEYSASRQSSLPINRDCQQTATNYLLYQSRAYTEHHIFFALHKLFKRYMKAQQLVQCIVPRALFGGVRNASKSVYSSDSQLLLSRPSVSGAYLRSTQEKQLLRYRFYCCFQCIAAVLFISVSAVLIISSMKQLKSFMFLVTVVLFLVCSRCFVFLLPSNHFARQNLRRTERKYRWTDSVQCQNS